jgi:hypothetical protein
MTKQRTTTSAQVLEIADAVWLFDSRIGYRSTDRSTDNNTLGPFRPARPVNDTDIGISHDDITCRYDVAIDGSRAGR